MGDCLEVGLFSLSADRVPGVAGVVLCMRTRLDPPGDDGVRDAEGVRTAERGAVAGLPNVRLSGMADLRAGLIYLRTPIYA